MISISKTGGYFKLLDDKHRIIISKDGKVGIGTTSPAAKLDTAGVIRATDTTAMSTGIGLEMHHTNDIGYLISFDRANTLYKPLNILGTDISFGKTGTIRMTILENGKVGIGTMNPLDILTIFDIANDPYIRIGYDDDYYWKIGRNSGDAGKLYINNKHGGEESNKVVIDINGNVSIGTTDTGVKLTSKGTDVVESGTTYYPSIRSWNDLSLGSLRILDMGGYKYYSYIQSWDGTATFTPLLLNPRGGNVGIGTTDPKSKLHVVGLSIYANNAAAISGGLTAGAFYRTGADPDLVCVVH